MLRPAPVRFSLLARRLELPVLLERRRLELLAWRLPSSELLF
ncbi:hypothetical protein [Duganella rivi]|nr:hypothetical protein [Duganella rivi]